MFTMPSPRALASLALMSSTVLAQSATQLWTFPTPVSIENSALRPNRHVLLTTFDQAKLYDLDPFSSTPQAELVTAFPGATAITGIAPIGNDIFAVIGGVRGNYSYENETIYTVDLKQNAAVKTVVTIPEAVMLNGMASLPEQPNVVLIADSRVGCLFRVDLATGIADVAFRHELLTAPADAAKPIGVNGLNIVGEHVYFTNTARGILARIPIDQHGKVVGDAEVIANSPSGKDWDDFAVHSTGTIYLAQSDNALASVSPDGEQTTVIGGADNFTLLGPTSVTIAGDGKSVYVTTRGGTVDGVAYSGQVVQVQL